MTPFDTVCARLEPLPCRAPHGERRVIAKCPSHPDNFPSLSVRELSDQRVLIHCYAGCCAKDVVEAVGLSLADLYPSRLRISPAGRRGRGSSQASPLLRQITIKEIEADAWHVYACARVLRDGQEINAEAIQTLCTIIAKLDPKNSEVKGE